MSIEKNLIGFELGSTASEEFDLFNAGCSIVNDPLFGVDAHTGFYYLRIAPSASLSQARIAGSGVVLNGSYAGSGHLRWHIRFFMRVNAYPASQTQIGSLGTVTGLFLDNVGQLVVNFVGHAGVNGPVIPLGAWHLIDLSFDMDGGTPATSGFSISMDGGATTTVTQVNAGPFGVGQWSWGINTNQTFSFDVDDVFYYAADQGDAGSPLVLPTRTRIIGTPIVSQGGTNQWTGSYASLQSLPPTTSPDSFQSSAVNGQVVTWQKDFHDWNNISGTVQAIKLYIWARFVGSGSASAKPLINGAVVNTITNYPLAPAGYPANNRIVAGFDFTEYSLAAFDALEYGMQQAGTLQINVGAVMGEVLCDVTTSPSVTFTTIAPSVGPVAGGTRVVFNGRFSRTTGGIVFGDPSDGHGALFTITSLTPTMIIGTTGPHVAGTVDIYCPATTKVMTQAYTYQTLVDSQSFALPDARRDPAITIQRQINDQVSTFSLETSTQVLAGTPIEIDSTDRITALIKGVAVRSTLTIEDSKFNLKWQIDGVDRQYYLAKYLVVGTYTNQAADVVILDILKKFAPDFTPTGVQAGMPAVTVAFYRDCNVPQALTKIMQMVSGHWFMGLDNIIYCYIGAQAGGPNPATVNDLTQDGLLLDPPISIQTDWSQLRNRIYVRGRGDTSGATPSSGGSPTNPSTVIRNAIHPFNGSQVYLSNIDNNSGGITVLAQQGARANYGGYYTYADGSRSIFQSFGTTAFNGFPVVSPPLDVLYPNKNNGHGTVDNQTGVTQKCTINVQYWNLYTMSGTDLTGPLATGLTIFRQLQAGDPNLGGLGGLWYHVADVTLPTGPYTGTAQQIYFVDNTPDSTLVATGAANPQPSYGGVTGTGTGASTNDPSANGSSPGSPAVTGFIEDKTAQANAAAIEGGDGVHEFQIDDPTILTVTEANAVAAAELALFKDPIVTVTYASRDPNTLPGRTVTFNLTNPPLVGSFKIQSVTIDQIHENDTLVPRFTAVASSVRFTLDDLLRRVMLSTAGGSNPQSASNVTGAGTGGTPTNTRKAFNEIPAGAVNGSNLVYTTANTRAAGTLAVYLNGLRQRLTTDYTENSLTQFTMVTAPQTGDTVYVDYQF